MWRQRKGNKFGNVSKVYGGRVYHSKLEAGYARDLELRKKAGEITEIIPQYKIDLSVNGYHICNYYCDFKIILADGSIELHEVKGFETEIYRLKRKLLEATLLKEHPEIEYIVIK